jgi:hypothetical protein
METLIPKSKDEHIIVDCCECGKNKQRAIVKQYYSENTDENLIGTWKDCGFAWIKILDRHILEIDSVNQTLPYRRNPAGILKGIELTQEQEKERLIRLEQLAVQHPGLYKLAKILTDDNIEPIKIVLKRLVIRIKKKKIDGLEYDKADKQDDIGRINKKIKNHTEELKQLVEGE